MLTFSRYRLAAWILAAAVLSLTFSARTEAGLVVDGTRVIYPAGER